MVRSAESCVPGASQLRSALSTVWRHAVDAPLIIHRTIEVTPVQESLKILCGVMFRAEEDKRQEECREHHLGTEVEQERSVPVVGYWYELLVIESPQREILRKARQYPQAPGHSEYSKQQCRCPGQSQMLPHQVERYDGYWKV